MILKEGIGGRDNERLRSRVGKRIGLGYSF